MKLARLRLVSLAAATPLAISASAEASVEGGSMTRNRDTPMVQRQRFLARAVVRHVAISLIVFCAWIPLAAAKTSECATPPGSVAALFDADGAPVHAYVTTDGIP